jgi:hypothetical protein
MKKENPTVEKKKPTVSNYDRLNENWRNLFLQMDHEELARRFRLKMDDGALYITFYSRQYRLDRRSGAVTEAENPDAPVSFDESMSILNMLYYSRPGASVSGRFVPFRDVKGASPFAPAFEKSVASGLAAPFEGRLDALKHACEALSGEKIPQGDAGYILRAFDFMPVMLVFWDGDDEFAAQANLLFDARITDFTHEESVCCIAGALMHRLQELAGV